MTQLVPFNDDDEDQKDWAGDPKKMGFLDHLEELRWVLIKPLIVFAVTFGVVMAFIKKVSDLLMWPLQEALINAGQTESFEALATRNPMGVYSAMLQIGLIIGFAVTLPFIVYYGAQFIGPALTKKERRLLIPGSLGVFFFFMSGSSFSFFLLLPKTIEITIWFNALMGFQLIWTPDSYFSFMLWLVVGMGLAFQFPLAVLILVYLGVIDSRFLVAKRRIMIFIIFIVSAFLTPPDPITQAMVAVPLCLLYEFSIWAAKIIEKRKIRAEALEDYDSND